MSPDRRILVMWLVAVGVITWREMKYPAPDAVVANMPRPWAYSGSAIVYGSSALISELNGPIGQITALAWTVAILISAASRSQQHAKVTNLNAHRRRKAAPKRTIRRAA